MAAPDCIISGKYDYAFFVSLESKGKKSVLEWCMLMNLISKEYECPNCKAPMELEEKNDNEDGYIRICRQNGKNQHIVERSVRKGTFFERSTLSLTTIFFMIYLWVKKATYDFIEDELCLEKAIILDWIIFLQEVCVDICIRRNVAIGGEGLVVEVAESKFQKRKFIKNDNAVGKWVYIGFEKETDKGFYAVVEKRSKKFLYEVIEKYVSAGSVVVSELWKEYDCLEEDCFIDLNENADIKFEELGVGTYGNSLVGMRKTIKRTCNDLKRFSTDSDLYLAEYMFRRSNSDNSYLLMRSFLKEIIITCPPANKD